MLCLKIPHWGLELSERMWNNNKEGLHNSGILIGNDWQLVADNNYQQTMHDISEDQLTTNQGPVTPQRSEEHNYTLAEDGNFAMMENNARVSCQHSVLCS